MCSNIVTGFRMQRSGLLRADYYHRSKKFGIPFIRNRVANTGLKANLQKNIANAVFAHNLAIVDPAK